MKLEMFSLALLFSISSVSMTTKSRFCLWSNITAVRVDICPETKSDMEQSARMKNCSSFAAEQNCTKPGKFKYHCLMNELESAFFEVCAEEYVILGYCAEYNVIGALVQPHWALECNKNISCPKIYNSTDAYLYKDCYDVVKKKIGTSSKELPTSASGSFSTQLTSIESNDPTTESTDTTSNDTRHNDSVTLSKIKISHIIFLVFSVVVFIVGNGAVLYWKRHWICQKDSGNTKKNDEEIRLLNVVGESPEISNRNLKNCKEGDYFKEIESAKLLQKMVSEKETDLEKKRNTQNEETKAFLSAFKEVCNSCIDTELFKKCKQSLEDNGIAIVIGQQGCGKTLIAVRTMLNYEDQSPHKEDKWKTLKFTSWGDLLTFECQKDKTLVYIDNMMDGWMNESELQRWWSSLCFFYFTHCKNNTRLLITAKDDVIEEACEHIAQNITKQPFCLNAKDFPLNYADKKLILESQLRLAESKGIRRPIDSIFDEIDKELSCNIGFPLCAHLYAFENDVMDKSEGIFINPRLYVKTHIKKEIDNDGSQCVRTLFLFLLCHISASDEQSPEKRDIWFGDVCRQFLEEKLSKEYVENIPQTAFDNLLEKANSLKDTILVEHHKMFAFKHQIYHEGVSDYFFREDSSLIQHFHLDILRPYGFHDFHRGTYEKICHRLKKEIPKGIQGVLNCKIFMEPGFENQFCEELKKDNTIDDLLFNPDFIPKTELPFIYWTNYYRLPILSKLAESRIYFKQNNLKYIFYQARFGECCKINKKVHSQFMTSKEKNFEKAVWKFRTTEGRSILHMIVSSDKSDYDAQRILNQLFKDADDHNASIDKDLLDCALEQTNYSRILCIKEILKRQNIALPKVSINKVTEPIRLCKEYSACLELEIVVRVCILREHKLLKFKTAEKTNTDKNYECLKALMPGRTIPPTEMRDIIKKCIKKNGKDTLAQSFEEAICESIEILSKKNS